MVWSGLVWFVCVQKQGDNKAKISLSACISVRTFAHAKMPPYILGIPIVYANTVYALFCFRLSYCLCDKIGMDFCLNSLHSIFTGRWLFFHYMSWLAPILVCCSVCVRVLLFFCSLFLSLSPLIPSSPSSSPLLSWLYCDRRRHHHHHNLVSHSIYFGCNNNNSITSSGTPIASAKRLFHLLGVYMCGWGGCVYVRHIYMLKWSWNPHKYSTISRCCIIDKNSNTKSKAQHSKEWMNERRIEARVSKNAYANNILTSLFFHFSVSFFVFCTFLCIALSLWVVCVCVFCSDKSIFQL